MSTFLGGVRDAQGARAFIPVAPDTTVAVDIATGTILWRRDRIGRPIAATAARLVTLETEGDAFVLRLLDAATGTDAGRVTGLGMPDWAAVTATMPDAVHVDAVETADGVRVDWRMRRLYRGGAPPPDEIAAQAQQEASGAFVLHPDTAKVSPAAPSSSSARAPGAGAAAETPPLTSAEPNVIALDRVGGRVFALKVQTVGDKTFVQLEARDMGTHVVLWTTPLAERAASRPRPPRK